MLSPLALRFKLSISLIFWIFILLTSSAFQNFAVAGNVEKAIIEDFSNMVTKQDTGINDFYGNIGEFNKNGILYGRSSIIIDNSSTNESSTGMRFTWNFTINNDNEAYTGVFFCIFGLCDTKATFNGDKLEKNAQTVVFNEHSINLNNIDGVINEPEGARKFETLTIDLNNSGTELKLRVEIKDVNNRIRFWRFPVNGSSTITWDFRNPLQYKNGGNGDLDITQVKVISLVIERNNYGDGISNPDTGSLDIKGLWFTPNRPAIEPSNNDDKLDLLEMRAFQYFIDWTSRKSASLGIPQDRSSFGDLLSMGGVGFGLPAYVIGAERGWITRSEARSRTLAMLRILANPNSFGSEPIGRIGYKGWFYHFLGVDGKRKLNFDFASTPADESLNTVELSTIDTGLAVMGVLTAQSYFTGSDVEEVEIRNLAQSIYDRVDWSFMLEANRQQFYLAWKPEKSDISNFRINDNDGKGYFSGSPNAPQTLDFYTDEGLIVSFLALGSTTHTVPRSVYWCIIRDKDSIGIVRSWPGALFTYQFMQAFMDMRDWVISDSIDCPPRSKNSQIDWFSNSQMAIRTAINEAIANPKGFQNYGQSSWGVSAAEGPDDNYFAYSIPKIARDSKPYEDGTITNYGMISSLGFSMKNGQVIDQGIYTAVMQGITGSWTRNQWHYRFGLPDAYNSDIQPATIAETKPDAAKSNPPTWLRKSGSWVNRALFSIDQGPMLLHIENARSGLIWNLLSNNQNVVRAKQRLNSVNQPPQTTDLSFTGGSNSPIMGKLNGTDPENSPLKFGLKEAPIHGSATINPDGTFVYIPTGGYSGSDGFSFLVDDGTDIASGKVTLEIGNRAPVAKDGNVETMQSVAVNGQLLATDPDNNVLSLSTQTQPTHGTVTITTGGAFVYTPIAGYSGTDRFTFQVTDGSAIATANVLVKINSVLPPALTSEPLPGVVSFVTGKSKLGLMSLVYCDQDCQTIFYRHLLNDGTWSSAEVVKTNWNRNNEFGPGTFAMDIDSLGRPHVFWGENLVQGDPDNLAHGIRNNDGSWSTTYESASTYGMIGRLNKVTITTDDQISLLTTVDYIEYGRYTFSYLGYFSGKVGTALSYQDISIGDEALWDIDLAIGSDAKPVFAVAQQQWGGSLATKIVYQSNNAWTNKIYRSGWNYCVRPIRVIIDANIHVNSCGYYYEVPTPDGTPVLGNTSFVDDMTIDGMSIAYFSHSTNQTIVIGRANSDKSILIGDTYDIYLKCGYISLCRSKILYNKNQNKFLVTYVDNSKDLYVKIFAKDAVTQYLDSPYSPLVVNKQGTGSGSITSGDGAINCGDTCTKNYFPNTEVILTAQPRSDTSFLGWKGACSNVSGDCKVTLSQAKTVTAIFNLKLNQLSVQKQGGGAGSIYSSPNGIQCGTDCAEGYTANTSVTLYAIPSAGSSFVEWGGDCSGSATTCTVTLSAAKNVTANFVPNYALTVTNSNMVGGKVSCEPGGMICGNGGNFCTQSYPSGTVLTCTVIPLSGYSFTGWGGDCAGTASTCQITLNALKNLSANFVPNYTLTVINLNPANGTVTSDTGGIVCGATCSANFDTVGASVKLTAIPVAGYQFAGWGGSCREYGNTYKLTMDAAKSCTAKFEVFKKKRRPSWRGLLSQ